jgi:hypothetical protein
MVPVPVSYNLGLLDLEVKKLGNGPHDMMLKKKRVDRNFAHRSNRAGIEIIRTGISLKNHLTTKFMQFFKADL